MYCLRRKTLLNLVNLDQAVRQPFDQTSRSFPLEFACVLLQLSKVRAVESLEAGLALLMFILLPLGMDAGIVDVVNLPATVVGE